MSLSLQETLLTVAGSIALWIFRRLTTYLKRIADDFDEIKKLPEKLEAITVQFNVRFESTERKQAELSEQLKMIVEKLIEQGPPK